MTEATDINKQLQLDFLAAQPGHSSSANTSTMAKEKAEPKPPPRVAARPKGFIDLTKLQHLKNPYDMELNKL